MDERPILFSGPLVRAILANRKKVTRRIITRDTSTVSGTRWPLEHWDRLDFDDAFPDPGLGAGGYLKVACPDNETRHRVRGRFEIGRRLWVRESYRLDRKYDGTPPNEAYKHAAKMKQAIGVQTIADDEVAVYGWKSQSGFSSPGKGRPSIHMPRWASRISLDVLTVRAERLHSITDEEAVLEGIDLKIGQRLAFRDLWDKINGKRHDGRFRWERNPWVWRIEFARVA